MPDIMRDGSNELLLWLDELCSTCDVNEDCPLVRAIKVLDLTTYGGCHVAGCNRYEGDPVMTLDTDVEGAKATNLATLTQELEKSLAELQASAELLEEMDIHG